MVVLGGGGGGGYWLMLSAGYEASRLLDIALLSEHTNACTTTRNAKRLTQYAFYSIHPN